VPTAEERLAKLHWWEPADEESRRAAHLFDEDFPERSVCWQRTISGSKLRKRRNGEPAAPCRMCERYRERIKVWLSRRT